MRKKPFLNMLNQVKPDGSYAHLPDRKRYGHVKA
jgi:hypothetical protein